MHLLHMLRTPADWSPLWYSLPIEWSNRPASHSAMPSSIGLYVNPARWLTMSWAWGPFDQKWHDWVILHWILYWCIYFSSNLYYPTFIPIVIITCRFILYLSTCFYSFFSSSSSPFSSSFFPLFFLPFSLYSLPPQLPHVNVIFCSLTSLTPPPTSTRIWHRSQRWDYGGAHDCGWQNV